MASLRLSALLFAFFLMIPPPPRSTLFPYTTLFRSVHLPRAIGFCAALYSLGLPPELLGLADVTNEELRIILKNAPNLDRKSTRLNSSHTVISYAVFCLKKKKKKQNNRNTCRT